MLKVLTAGIQILALTSLLQALTACAEAAKVRCPVDVVAAMKAGGFSGRDACDGGAASLLQVGLLETKSGKYAVYDYRYSFRPPQGQVDHGGQRIIFIDSKSKYVGQYALSPPPFAKVNASAGNLTIQYPTGKSEIIKAIEGLPQNIIVDGERVPFFK